MRAVSFFRQERAAERRLDAQDFEEVRADHHGRAQVR
jgi:hypothetical protein